MMLHPQMTLREALEHQRELARRTKLDRMLVEGRQSHAPKWHAFSIMGHIRCVTYIAQQLATAGAIHPDLVVTAAWHDVGKFISIQYGPDGPTFHDHAEAGAKYIEQTGAFPAHIVDAIRWHGTLKHTGGPNRSPLASSLLPWLELCDELGKWNDANFPPEGSERTRRKRMELLQKVVVSGVPPFWVSFAEGIVNREKFFPFKKMFN